MISKAKVTAVYNCTLKQAFKTPILSDISKVHTGYTIVPRVTHCTDDENWGKPGHAKKVYVADTLIQKGGLYSTDKVIERIENKLWILEVSNFQPWMYGFHKFVGRWQTTELELDKILIEYSYELHSNLPILYPFHWLFAKILWSMYMKRVVENIRNMIDNEEPYLFD